ncbi:hypothetical protein EAH78_13120 [Pseudomonas arsenicoxydans]|uniref:Uncharacterized protein n=1 Tax=Pseudomonas arsenicoxydans TaxID=702115 RepID=A0A502HZ55_9PSED|nr:hypothetical protein EAH78_13120 [Pseudomonas arsenicoxydans]
MRMTVHSFGFVGVVKGFNGTPGQKLNDGGLRSPPVGAGLLAKAVCQSIFMLNGTPLSRASPLPHLLCGD